jgi:hypothetical protein
MYLFPAQGQEVEAFAPTLRKEAVYGIAMGIAKCDLTLQRQNGDVFLSAFFNM